MLKLCGLVVAGVLLANVAFAQSTEVQLGLSLLEYSNNESESDLENSTTETETSSTITVDPNINLHLYSGKYLAYIDIEASESQSSGALTLGYLVMDNIYAHVSLNIEKTKDESETKPDGGTSTKTESEVDNLVIGAGAIYRVKTPEKMMLAGARLIRGALKGEVGTTSIEVTTTALTVAGQYYMNIFDRVYAGVGLEYVLGISGDTEVEVAGASEDGDYEFSRLSVKLLNVFVEL